MKSEIQSPLGQYLPEILDDNQDVENTILTDSMGISIASERVLKKDWLRPEEDEAWRDFK